MKISAAVRRFLTFVFPRSCVDQEIEEELRSHLQSRASDLERQGLSRAEAERQARIEFGGYQRYKEECRDALGTRLLDEVIADARYAIRHLRRSPGFAAAAVITLALGIGANAAVFSIVNAVVLHPLPHPHSDRLIWIVERVPALKTDGIESTEYVAWKEQSQTLDQITACGAGVSFNLTGRSVPARIPGAYVSASFFATLGVEPQWGRGFTADEDQPYGGSVAILMHSFWQQYFGSDPHALGQTVTLDSVPHTVLGVMPPSFRFPGDSEAQILVPAGLENGGGLLSASQNTSGIIGLLKPGVTVARARSELEAVRRHAEGYQPGTELRITPLADHLAGNLRPAVLVLLGVVGLVLLIACANVANLMLARASARTREMAVRAVLGAGHWRLIRQLLVESVTLALAGGAAGLLLAGWSINLMTRSIPAIRAGAILSVARPHVDGIVLLFALILSVVTGILFGLAPAIAAARPDLAERLKDGELVPSGNRRGGWLRGMLAVAELSLALVLLIGAGLLIKSFYRLLAVEPGFVPERVLTMNISLTVSRYPTRRQRNSFFSEVLHRVESLPGVRSAALADSLPLTPYSTRMAVPRNRLATAAGVPTSAIVSMPEYAVSPAYFYTLGIPLLRGRTFTSRDEEQASRVVVVNESLASLLWPGKDPVGKPLPLFGDKLTVVGVVGNIRHEGLNQGIEPEIYKPYPQENKFLMHLAVRTALEPASLTSAIRSQVMAIDPEQPIYNVATLEQVLSDSVAPRRFNMVLLGVFASVALALATVGIYGVIAFSVTQRTHEIGIRMALGAEQRDVLVLVVWQAFKLILGGVAIGIGGALALTRFLTSLLYGIEPTDPLTFGAVSLILSAVALVGSYIPAYRATRVDPTVALRYQ